MTKDKFLNELKSLWQEHEGLRLPPIVEGDDMAFDLRYDIMEYDSRIAGGVINLLAGKCPLHPRRFDKEHGLLDRVNNWIADNPGSNKKIREQYHSYVLQLDRLGELAENIWAISRHK